MWFFRSPEIVFGEYALDHLVSVEGRKAFVVTDETLVALGFVDRVQEKLSEAGMEAVVFADVEPDPSIETARRGAEVALAHEPDWIIGLGGGSCIDAAKAIWVLYERPEVDPAEISPLARFGLRAKARLIAIPTTSGTGAEATLATVLTDQAECRKLGLGTPELVPDLAIVDPSFVMALPPQLAADTGMDALTHAVEGYTSTCRNDFTDGLALKAIQLVFEYLPRAYESGADDPEAREKMHNAGTIAGLAYGNSMLAQAHALGHALGAIYHTPHGRAVGVFLPYTIEFNAASGESRYADIARFLGLAADDEAQAAASLAAAIRELQQRIGVATSLREMGITEESFRQELSRLVANTEMDTQVVFGPRMPTTEEVEQLFEYSFSGKPVDF